MTFTALNIDNRGDKLILYDGNEIDPNKKMTGPLDPIEFGNTKIEAIGTKRPYFSSSKYLTIQLITNDNFEQSGFQVSSTALKKGEINLNTLGSAINVTLQ